MTLSPRWPAYAMVALASALALILVTMTEGTLSRTTIASEPGDMDAMSVDMNPHGIPANTATSIGSREFCARINENDFLDADEDDIDTLEIDVTTGPEGIPASNPMIAYSFILNYLSPHLTIVDVDPLLLIAAAPGSQPLTFGVPTPDNSGDYAVNTIDLNTDAPASETGPGVLARISIEAGTGTPEGIHDLLLTYASHIGRDGAAVAAAQLNHAVLAVDIACPGPQPPPAPPPKPENDDFANAIPIQDLPFHDSREGYFGSTESATTEEDEPTPCGGIGRTLWYSLTLTDDAPIRIDYSSFGMVIAVYRGTSLGTLTPILCDYTGEARQFSAKAGETYFIQWGGFNGAALTGSLRIVDADATPTPTPPLPTAVPSGGMDAMSIDMNPHGIPANTATSIGSREFCARINENDLLDADEVDVDRLEIDVTTGPDGIPEATSFMAFQLGILYKAGIIRIIGEDLDFLLFNNAGSAPSSNVGDTMPDSDGRLISTGVDSYSPLPGTTPESGPGILARLMIEAEPGAASGVYHLVLDESESAHMDLRRHWYPPLALNHAVVAIGVDCPLAQPTPPPTPSPTPTAPPTPTPTATPVPTATPSPTQTATPCTSCDVGGLPVPAFGDDGPAALPAAGGHPATTDGVPIAGLTIVGLGIVVAAAWAAARAAKR